MTNLRKIITQAAWGVFNECQKYHCQLQNGGTFCVPIMYFYMMFS